jgi:hypothetical protein
MRMDASNTARSRESYFGQTHRPINALVFILPLMLVFHVGSAVFGARHMLKGPEDLKRIGRLLVDAGPVANLVPAMLLVCVLLLMQFSRHEKWTVQKKAVLGMTLESLLWMTPLVAIVILTGKLLLAAQAQEDGSVLRGVILACGAGIYEEFLFRLLLVGGAILLLAKVLGLKRTTVAIWASVLAALAFSLYHFGPKPFNFSEIIIRAVAGLYLAGLYLYRGFGIAVGAHVAYDIYAALAPHGA